MSNTKLVLEQAAELIRRHGWVQRKFGSEGEGFCLVGAVISASPNEEELRYRAYEELVRVTGVVSVLAWNDTEGRTQEEVLELLERAANDRK